MTTLIRESREFPARGAIAPHKIVLRKMDNGAYATHWHNLEDKGYYHGHYFDTFAWTCAGPSPSDVDAEAFSDALEDFNKRVEINEQYYGRN